jgi:L-ascorbate metabolism protein UlaG (beta-lactamase superfamily)
LASAAAYAAHVKGRSPNAVIVALTHDHGDHMGDYFELLPALVAAGVDVKTVGQSDLMRVALVPKFKAANLDNTQIVRNGGAGINMGGTASYKGVKIELVPAVHSTASGYPAAGFIIDVGGARVYASGDTDVFGDMALIGSRYKPDLAIVSSGTNPARG